MALLHLGQRLFATCPAWRLATDRIESVLTKRLQHGEQDGGPESLALKWFQKEPGGFRWWLAHQWSTARADKPPVAPDGS